jgi:HlyD family secretion protein
VTQSQATGNQTNTTAAGQVTTSQSNVNTAAANPAAVTAQGQVATAQGQLGVAVANLATAQHNLENATLTAPHDGTVTTVNGTVGGTPGVPTNGTSTSSATTAGSGTFVQIVDLNSLQVQANVNESDTANLRVGQHAVFTVNAYGNRQFNGTVSGISPNGVTVSNVVTYPVNIDVDLKSANGANLLPNMTANATITVVQRTNVPQISVNAINFARLASSGSTGTNAPQLVTRQQANTALNQARQMLGTLENQNPNVALDSPIPAYVIERPGGGDVFTAKPVVLGLTDGTNYEVLEGLSPGETYIVGSGNSTRPAAGATGGNSGNQNGG